jgi:DNA-binding transcriptional LysR family regulator
VKNITDVDLSLLVLLQTVFEEGSVTRAAKRLGITGAAVSKALTQLRALFEDELVVRHGRGLRLRLTPRALILRPHLDALIREAEGASEAPARFDPATSDREFRLACADYHGAVVVPALVARLRELAPRATLRVHSLDELISEHGLERDVDVHVGIPPELPSECRSSLLFKDRFVCVSRPGRSQRRLSLEAFLEASHVRVSVLGRTDPVDLLLEARGLRRSVAVVVPYFSIVPFVVRDTGLLAAMSWRLATAYASRVPLGLSELPVELPAYGVRMIWHQRTDKDPGARFFRRVLKEVMSGALPAP